MKPPIIMEVREKPNSERISKFTLEQRLDMLLRSVEVTADLWGLEINHWGPREAMIDFFIRERENGGS